LHQPVSMYKISREDGVVIKALRVEKKWNSRRFLEEFPIKARSRTSLDRLITNIDNGLPTDKIIGRVVEGQ